MVFCMYMYAKEYLQESLANSTSLDMESCHVMSSTGNGNDDIEAALNGTATLTNATLQVSNATPDN